MPKAAKAAISRIVLGKARRTDQWWVDPSLVMREAGLEPDPWQAEVLSCPDRNLLFNVTRQGGKSNVAGALAIKTAILEAPALSLILSKSLRQAGELFRVHVMPMYHCLLYTF